MNFKMWKKKDSLEFWWNIIESYMEGLILCKREYYFNFFIVFLENIFFFRLFILIVNVKVVILKK